MNNEKKAKELSAEYKQYTNAINLHLENTSKEDVVEQCVHAATLEMAQWKDEQVKQLLIEKTKFLSPSAAMDSVRRCTIEKIYEELFNEGMSNSNPYIK